MCPFQWTLGLGFIFTYFDGVLSELVPMSITMDNDFSTWHTFCRYCQHSFEDKQHGVHDRQTSYWVEISTYYIFLYKQ